MKVLALLFLGISVLAASAADPSPRWWKGNLHTHSLWSDGDDFPEMITDWYKEHGYHFLALSDHNLLSDHERWISVPKKSGELAFSKYLSRFGDQWVEVRDKEGDQQVRLKTLREFRVPFEEPNRFLMIQSEEITTRTIHINGINLQELILPYTSFDPQNSESVVKAMNRTVNAVLDQRKRTGVPMFAHINHPNFQWAITAEELMQVENGRFFEIYNGHPSVHNEGDEQHASIERVWDIILSERLRNGKNAVLGLASDDSHHYHNEPNKMSRTGRGWVMVRAAKLEVADLITALEAGDFYASSGVTLKDVRMEKDRVSLEIDAEPGVTYVTEFIGTRKGYDTTSEPVLGADGKPLRVTRRYSKEVGAVLGRSEDLSPSYQLNGDEMYIRARVTSSKLQADANQPGERERAWTQPLIGEGKP